MRPRNRKNFRRSLRESDLARLKQLESDLAREKRFQRWVWVVWILATVAGLCVGTSSGIWFGR